MARIARVVASGLPHPITQREPYRVSLYAIQTPRTPPAAHPSKEATPSDSAPKRTGAYPPMKEPAIIPNMIIVFSDMAISRISGVQAHLDGAPKSKRWIK